MAIPAVAAAATLTVTGTSAGTATAQPPEAGATCNPTAPAAPSDLICDFDIVENFTLTDLGTGTYTGTTRLDWSIYTGAEPCAELTGTTTLTSDEGTITLSILDSSRVCETASPTVHSFEMDATVTGGTGAYAGATGTFSGTGTLTARDAPTVYDMAQQLSGSVVVPDPATLTVVKETATDTDEDFVFSLAITRAGGPNTSGGFALGNDESEAFAGAGTYRIAEVLSDEQIEAGWSLEEIDCGDAEVAVEGVTLDVTIGAGDEVTCVFSNALDRVSAPANPAPASPGQLLPDTGADASRGISGAALLLVLATVLAVGMLGGTAVSRRVR